MITRTSRFLLLSYAYVLFRPSVCHMQMSWPYPLRSEFDPANNWANIDYSMTAPLSSDGSNFPCKGYQNDRPIRPVVTWTAGSKYNMTLAGTATHGGGSCQLSLSYDNGATFRVVKSVIGGCPLNTEYGFQIPSYAPAGLALFAWTWQNLIGNREFYMNCAEVSIVSTQRKQLNRKQTHTSFGSLPFIWKGNLEGVSDCVTVANKTVVYPQPGPQVVYDGGMTNSDPPSPGDCNSPRPYGQTYKDLYGNGPSPAFSSSQTSTAIGFGPFATPLSRNNQHNIHTSALASTAARIETGKSTWSESQVSTTTITLGCEETVTLTTMPTYYITAAACTGTSASCPCTGGYACRELSPCIWGCASIPIHHPTTSLRTTHRPTSTKHIMTMKTTHRVIHSKTTTIHHESSPTPHHNPSYVNPSLLNHYLPCVPGTFICLNTQTWDTCDYDARGHWVYGYPREVAAGMKCLPKLARYGVGTSRYGQQAGTPKGYYRDDQIVRA